MMTLLRKAKKAILRPVSLFTFSCIVSIGTLLFYNLPFFQFVIDKSSESVWLVVSLVIIMLAVNFMMTCLAMFCLRIVGRILLAIFSIINLLVKDEGHY